jgi:hypothetical protein
MFEECCLIDESVLQSKAGVFDFKIIIDFGRV